MRCERPLARWSAVALFLMIATFLSPAGVRGQGARSGGQDPDGTPAGQARVDELEERAREVYRRRDTVDAERRPLALERDPMALLITKHQGLGREMVAALTKLNRQAQIVNNNLQNAQGNDVFTFRRQLRILQGEIDSLDLRNRANNDKIDLLVTELATINEQIAPLDKELARLWTDIEEIRGGWTDMREPAGKFARGDYEALYEAVDDWQQSDVLWPSGYHWKALCAYELGDINEAEAHANKAEEIRTKVLGMTDPVSESEAVLALVHTRMGGKYAARAKDRFAKAIRLANKDPNWFTNFVVGRNYVDKETDATRAKLELERSLKVKPKNPCATVWLARLQTTAKKETVRDVSAGTQTLEAMWADSGERSWRLGYFLVEAYVAANRKKDAEALWKTVLSLTPTREQGELRERYARLSGG